MNKSEVCEYSVYWPGGKSSVERIEPAPRPNSLNGLVIGFVWDYVFRGDEIFPIIKEELCKRFDNLSFVNWDVFGPTFGGKEAEVIENLPELLKQHKVDVAISGIGACGACTPATMRASAVIEKTNIPSVSLVTDGFLTQAKAISPGLGIEELPVARLVGHVDAQSYEELKQNIIDITVDQVVRWLTEIPFISTDMTVEEYAATKSYQPTEIVAWGSFEEINEIFYRRSWSDGLPIVPPTKNKVESFLSKTKRKPDEVLGIVQPSGSAVTVHNVAVNAVMANCQPDYMELILAISDVLVTPQYGVEHSGDTTGADAQIILNGPIIDKLNFNYGNGALRDGFQANSSVGRFVRLFLRNIARSLPGAGDKATFGHNYRVVLAESEHELKKIGWSSFAEDRGFEKGKDVVTLHRTTGSAMVGSVYGNDPEELSKNLADGLIRQSAWELAYTVGFCPATTRPIILISPMIAKTIHKAGVSKQDMKEMIFKHACIPAWKMERYIGHWTSLVPGQQTLNQLVAKGLASEQYALSDDPNRLVPVVDSIEHILFLVSGDPFRSNACVFGSNGMHGGAVSKGF